MTRRASTLVLVVALLAGAGACSKDPGDGARPPAPTSSAGASSGATGPTAAQKLTEQVLGGSSQEPALARAEGTITVNGEKHAVVAEALEVRAGSDTTQLRWRLSSTDGQTVTTFSSALSRAPLSDTRAVTVVDVAGKHALSPFTYVPPVGNGQDNGCACSSVPHSVDAGGEPMYALYPPLDPASTTVDITIPGFATMTSVPVTRP